MNRVRRTGVAAVAVFVMTGGAACGAGAAWTLEAYHAAVAATGRKMPLTDAQFAAIRARLPEAEQAITAYLADRGRKPDPRILQAFRELPREYFQYHWKQQRSFADTAFELPSVPYPIGFGSALSDFVGQVHMTQVVRPRPGDVALEIGTGSGYQAALLARLVKEMYSIEILETLGAGVGRIFPPLGLTNLHTRVGDGYWGWPEVAGGFDIIILTCAATSVPPPLLDQLKPGGRLLVPIGQPYKRGQMLYLYTKQADGRVKSRAITGCYFIPMKGELMKRAGAASSTAP